MLSQGFHGPYHKMLKGPADLSYAVDIAAPVGSIVVAARRGVVDAVFTHSDLFTTRTDLSRQEIDRWKARTNFILLKHRDDLRTLYVHLLKGSACIRFGDEVEEGQPLARVGLSGWVGDIPNLHFQVHTWEEATAVAKPHTQTLPFTFDGYDGPMEHEDLSRAWEANAVLYRHAGSTSV